MGGSRAVAKVSLMGRTGMALWVCGVHLAAVDAPEVDAAGMQPGTPATLKLCQ